MRNFLLTGLSIGMVAVACDSNPNPGSIFTNSGDSMDANGNPATPASGDLGATTAGPSDWFEHARRSSPPSAPSPSAFFVGGTVAGLHGTGMILQNNSGDDLPLNADGTFVFSKKVPSGNAFSITVKNQPTAPSQTCSVSGGEGTVALGNIATIVVNCATDHFTVGGSIHGLAGEGLVLVNNAGDPIPINANGTFAFPTTLVDGGHYAVTVRSQPTNLRQTCSVSNGAGDVAASNVHGISVSCVTEKYFVGGAITGLVGSGLLLENNDDGAGLPINASSGTFAFPTSLIDGSTFSVSIKQQPSSPSQVCSVSGGSGTIVGGDASAVLINCATSTFAVGGTVIGLAGSGLILQDNGGNDLAINANGAVAFSTPIVDQASYSVTVKNQPTNRWQTCVVSNGAGVIASHAVSNISILCTNNRYSVGGTLTGLVAGGSVIIHGGPQNTILTENGPFTSDPGGASGTTYQAFVVTNPTSPKLQTCTVTNGSGIIGGAPIQSIDIDCQTNTYSIGGTVTGLTGSGLVLRNNNGDDLPVSAASGAFTFATTIESQAGFAVSVQSQPGTPSQNCTVSGGSGTVTAGNIETVAVNCSTNAFTVGGTVANLDGTGLVLKNGPSEIPINANGTFAFPAQTDLSAYAVSVKTSPSGKTQTCLVTNGLGDLAGADITNVAISCTTNTYFVGGTVTGLAVGESVVLQNNASDSTTVGTAGTFTFTTKSASGSGYAATVLTPPAGKTCSVTTGTGTVSSSDISDIAIACSAVSCATFAGDDFEDGDSVGWTFGSGGGTPSVSSAGGANGTSKALQLTDGGGHIQGLRRTFTATQPSSLSVWVRPDGAGVGRNYILLGSGATVNNQAIFLYASSGAWLLSNQGTVTIAGVVPNVWVHFEFTFDWTAKTVTILLDGVDKGTYLFRATAITSVDQLNFYNYAAGATSQWDEVRMTCPNPL